MRAPLPPQVCEDLNECLATTATMRDPECSCPRCACINLPGTYKWVCHLMAGQGRGRRCRRHRHTPCPLVRHAWAELPGGCRHPRTRAAQNALSIRREHEQGARH